MMEILEEKSPKLAVAGGKQICIVRLANRVVAFENLCPHMGEELHKGKINFQNEIVCPLHAYKFNVETGDEENQRCGSLHFIRVITTSDGIYLDL